MSYKHMPRLGSAIASIILSVFGAVSLVGVDKAQAAVLTYQIDYDDRSYFKVDTSLLTGIGYEGYEHIPVFEGRFYGFTLPGGRPYYDLAQRATVLFYQGEFRGLDAGGSDSVSGEFSFPGDEQESPFYFEYSSGTSWDTYVGSEGTMLNGFYESYRAYNGGPSELWERSFYRDVPVYLTLVNTEPEPVPEPLTAGGTALALAGLSWLKHKKKMAA
jgi:hypothetical protein